MITKTFHHGFTLPTLLIISTVLMIMGAAVLQGTLSVKNALDAQFYNQIAREAAEAGVKYAQTCLAGEHTWSELRPGTTCTGAQNGSAPDVVLEYERYRTTFRVEPIDRRADGSTLIIARGTTELLRPSNGGVYRTFRETLGEAATTSSMNVLPETVSANHTVGTDGATYMLGYDNNVYSMGSNNNGQLGDGTTTDKNLPTDFKLPDGVYARKVVNGNANTFVIGSDGLVYGAGDNENGQLGNGTTNSTAASNPTVFEIPTSIYAVDVVTGGAGAGRNTFVLGSNGRVYGAGTNQYNQLHSTSVPAGCSSNTVCHTRIVLPAPDGERVRQMATTYGANNNSMLVVLAENGAVYGRGRNNQTQLGGSSTSDTSNRLNFTRINLPSGVLGVDIQTAYYNTYILGSNGQVYGFGQAGDGQLGNVVSPNNRYNTAQRFALPGSLTALKLAAGTTSNVAETDGNSVNGVWVLASDHQVYGSGGNHNGQLGNGSMANSTTPVRFSLPPGMTAQDVSSLYFTTCVLTNTREVYCAGSNKYGQLGIGNTTNQAMPRPFPLPGGVQAQSVSVGYGTVHVIGSDGNVYSAGRNDAGQLGDGTTTQRNSPVVMQRPSREVERRARTGSMSHVQTNLLMTDGTVWSSGDNNLGQFGNGSEALEQRRPVQFNMPNGYAREVFGGVFTTYALSSDGQLYGAGRNNRGQLGVSDTSSHATPVQYQLNNANMPANLTFRQFAAAPTSLGGAGDSSAGNETTFALASNNLVYGVGFNQYGQLGNGTTSQLTEPSTAGRFRLPSGVTARWAYFADGADINGAFVLGSNNVLYAAGLNAHGQLGIGNTSSTACGATCPTVNMPSGVTAVSASSSGYFSSYFIGSNGRPYATGWNDYGQLGRGSGNTTNSTSPVAMALPSGLTVKKLEAATGSWGGSVYMLASDGQVYAAGRNSHGQLGRGSTNNSANGNLAPVQLPGSLTAIDFWPGQENVFILASDGQIYGAGRNDSGQLGTGDKANKTTGTRFQLPSGVRAQSLMTQYGSRNNMDKWYFTGVIGSDGKLYVAGNNTFGQLTGNEAEVLTPREYAIPQPTREPGVIF